ncbi:hypothetical protein EMIHUDRAFT_419848 [Emiliania huxleyi CCMP1516]|uniref:NADP-dependent oxidoreductase domain-containing protein n=2 Tax=Emiliania huxleyi TaxID=2903 RepID=A0A0D3IBS9_EMIH1|nr:hypothetical protein EMIHUDRAFT_419848 [Emiliania huxleyi CCMP1516]EOD08714.1 hypothetical protein EMIHUDRAFT_419848 [Emiliania huxleyi CCMP1516]|eukprot:XP_005761143.1 hypothetical protein EMIHUDRAFT_419848 [Emiliania huxleyi CCMP1516]
MGIGAWAWGDSLFWKYDAKFDFELEELFEYYASQPDAFLDTAELYGLGRSEMLIGDFERRSGKRVKVASKFAALPWKTRRERCHRGALDVVQACEASLRRMGRSSMELYQIHFPNAWANEARGNGLRAYWDGLGDCYERGLVQAVGVSNYGADAVEAVSTSLGRRGIPLYSNQIQYSLLYPFANSNGLKRKCDQLGVKVLAYSPIGLGLLSGKYSAEQLPEGPRAELAKAFFNGQPETAAGLVDAVAKTAEKHGATPSQVAINWCVAKGTIPIPGARNLRQLKDNLGALSWRLDAADVARLDAASAAVQPLAKANPFPAKDVGSGLRMFDS